MKVLVCGGRDYSDREAVNRCLNALCILRPVTVVIHGGATGADRLAGEWAVANGVTESIFAADWETYGKRAGPMRNVAMAKLGADICLAFPGGSGTENMKATAKEFRILVIEATP